MEGCLEYISKSIHNSDVTVMPESGTTALKPKSREGQQIVTAVALQKWALKKQDTRKQDVGMDGMWVTFQ